MASSSLRAIAGSSRAVTASRLAPAAAAPARVLIPSRGYATPSPSPSPSSSPDWSLPEIHVGQTHPSRYGEHYDDTLSSDLLYMTYNHRLAHATPAATPVPEPRTPYELNRPQPLPRGNRPARPSAKVVRPDTIPRLESITIHTMVKEAIGNKQALLSAIMALRAISGETANGGGRSGSSGVQVVISRSGAAAFKLRAGMPVAAKVEIKGPAMYDFIQSLVDFVLPRIREFPGFALPSASAAKTSPSALGGVVSMGLPATAMALFPQVEANLDAYPRLHGFHMYFKTDARGESAQENARALLSGFRIPFHKR
ncbi:hypothetical protein JCM24511_00334 [Saitozyma sp. JCM 24511]|nr:hypothetical protein JCM24511_00334 [Saitozyma sp. JCM 24511]